MQPFPAVISVTHGSEMVPKSTPPGVTWLNCRILGLGGVGAPLLSEEAGEWLEVMEPTLILHALTKLGLGRASTLQEWGLPSAGRGRSMFAVMDTRSQEEAGSIGGWCCTLWLWVLCFSPCTK